MDIRPCDAGSGGIGIGCDIEEVDRFVLDRDADRSFLSRLFTEAELEYCFSFPSPAPHLAARYCAKEAVVKALSSAGRPPVDYRDIEVGRDPSGLPVVHSARSGSSDGLSGCMVRISLSHSRTLAMAVAFILCPDDAAREKMVNNPGVIPVR